MGGPPNGVATGLRPDPPDDALPCPWPFGLTCCATSSAQMSRTAIKWQSCTSRASGIAQGVLTIQDNVLWDKSGHPGTEPPLPYTILPVPCPGCPNLPWDNLGLLQDGYRLVVVCRCQHQTGYTCSFLGGVLHQAFQIRDLSISGNSTFLCTADMYESHQVIHLQRTSGTT